MDQSEPQDQSKGNLLEALPAEVHLLILENLPQKDLGAFSLCSKPCNNICLPLRLRNIELSPDAAKQFQNGGVYEHSRQYTQSLRFKWSNNGFEADDERYSDLSAGITTLSLFSCLKRLSIALKLLDPTERNIILAILKAIVDSNFRRTLEDLHLDVTHITYSRRSAEHPPYFTTYERLSASNREFFGGSVPRNDQLYEFMKTNARKLPMLKNIKFSIDGIPEPIDSLDSDDFDNSGFYYYFLATAPQLRALHVVVIRDRYWRMYSGEPEVLDPELIHTFSRITTLKIETVDIPQQANIQRLGERFPNLEHLNIQILETIRTWLPSYAREENSSIYEGIGNLKALKTVELPWLRIPGAPLHPDVLKELACQWRRGGQNCLKTVTFEGMKWGGKLFEAIQLRLEFHIAEDKTWKVEVCGDAESSEWMDADLSEADSDSD
ncbi:hypothetical protein TWF281_008885 [Arthrobotrys megalospora]